jgi:hypothetical protein
MKPGLMAFLASSLLVVQVCAGQEPPTTTDKNNMSYSIGVSIGKHWEAKKALLDSDIVAKGLRDGMTEAKATLSDQEMSQLAEDFKTSKLKNQSDAFLATNKVKISYMTGLDIGKTMLPQKANLDPDFVAKGFKDGITGGQTAMTDEEMRQWIDKFKAKRVKTESK